MNKQEGGKSRYYVQWDTHARHMCTVLCSLMEHQSMVDLAICCGANTIHAHKCVLAANSPYFREQLEKNAGTEQIIITGLDFAIVKSIIEFMYCGETSIFDENLKYMIAAAKFFQMRALQTLVSENQDVRYEADSIHIPPPMFLPKKPKYPNAYRPVNNSSSNFGPYKAPIPNDPYMHRKMKRKFVRSEAEKACAKEAAASRLALEALQKELATTSQMSSFIIEESCTETTVENFIPHADEALIENLNRMEGVPLQVVNYDDLNNSILTAGQMINIGKAECSNSVLQFGVRNNPPKDEIKRVFGNNVSENIEIVYRTNDGNLVNVTADVLQNLSDDSTLQYQIVDEHGQIRDYQELQVEEQSSAGVAYGEAGSVPCLEDSFKHSDVSDNNEAVVTTQNIDYDVSCSHLEMLNTNEIEERGLKDTNEALPQIVTSCTDEIPGENLSYTIVDSFPSVTASENDISNISVCSSCSSPDHFLNSEATFLDTKTDEPIPTNTTFNKPEEDSILVDSSETSNYLDLDTYMLDDENKENDLAYETHSNDLKRTKPIFFGSRRLRTMTADNLTADSSLSGQCSQTDPLECDFKDLGTDLDVSSEYADCKIPYKKGKPEHGSKPSTSLFFIEPGDGEVEMLDGQISGVLVYSPRITRSHLKTCEGNIYQNSLNESKEDVGGDDLVSHLKHDKPRRIMPSRKKK